jgi:hypothetical protein
MAGVLAPAGLSPRRITRLALLVTGIMAAGSCVLAQVARELQLLDDGEHPSQPASGERRLRRALSDAGLGRRGYQQLLGQVIDWASLPRIILIVDESSKGRFVHLVRVSLAYRGASIPLAWTIWRQQEPLPEGAYWRMVESVLALAARIVPADRAAIVVADRAYDIPPFIDRVAAHGWHWIVRCKARGTLRFRDLRGREHALAALVRRHLPAPGTRWKAWGEAFKDAGWRAVSVVGIWERTADEPLVVLTDLETRWEVLGLYGRRAWCEPGFRNDKRRGWQWEACQVRGLARHKRLLLALAWATVLTLLLGAEEAQQCLQRARASRRPPCKPQHARYSLFTLGLHRVQRWARRQDHGPFPDRLPDLAAPSWDAHWRAFLGWRFLFHFVRS